jgi:type II secretory pathway pseudopilin PulG
MNLKSANGLTLIELVVVMGVLFLLVISFSPCISNAPLQANMTAVGARGRDIFVAITRADTERAALGLPSLWPRDSDLAAETNRMEASGVAFTNSTDYFEWLIRGRSGALSERELRVTGLDYSKLAGAGVSSCPTNRHLTAKNNMWTVAANMRHDMSDLLPILVTRNIEASSLAARVTAQDHKLKSLRFDPGWETPFGDKGFVMIRKTGAIFKARPKYMKWGVIYQNQAFDTAQTPDGRVAPPLKYLTPTRVVTPGDQAYAEGAAVAYQLAGGRRGQIKLDGQEIVRSLSGMWGTA